MPRQAQLRQIILSGTEHPPGRQPLAKHDLSGRTRYLVLPSRHPVRYAIVALTRRPLVDLRTREILEQSTELA